MKRFCLAFVGLFTLAALAMPGVVSAGVNDFTITSFDAEQTLTRSDSQGELHIVERLTVDFTDQNHGLLRALPQRYKHHSLQLKVNSIQSATNAPTQYTTYTQNGNTVLKIGDPNRTVTGRQQYTIDYTVRNVISFYDDHTELYWDVNGDQWDQMFERVSVTLRLPEGLRLSAKPRCFTGSYGETVQQCVVTQQSNGIEVSTEAPLMSRQTLTYVAFFENGYFKPSLWYETMAEYSTYILGFTVPLLLLTGYAYSTWWRKGRDPKGTGVIVPQYDAPEGLRPMDVGAIIDFHIDNRDITATIIDLAVRGYIKIIEVKKSKRLSRDTLQYRLELTQADFSALNSNEKALLTALFSNAKVGATCELTASKSRLYTAASKLRSSVKAELTTSGYFRDAKSKSNLKRFGLFMLLALVGGSIGIQLAGGFFVAGAVTGLVLSLFFWLAMDARTAKGVAAKEHIVGLKLYLNTAEKDRIAKLQAPNAPYVAPTGEPEKTVELFEKLLPYAIVLGVEKQWAQQFESLYTTPPGWYSGSWTTFNSAYLANSITAGVGSAVNSSFTPPSSSSSSGSGGGGFSGGGGGGGGGGGW